MIYRGMIPQKSRGNLIRNHYNPQLDWIDQKPQNCAIGNMRIFALAVGNM
jgi:hypothetical protein